MSRFLRGSRAQSSRVSFFRNLRCEPLEDRRMLTAAPTLVDLQAASDSGLYDDDNLTNINTPTIDITAAEAGDVVRVYREGTLLGEAIQVEGTSYQYAFTADQLVEGANSITARGFDGVEESDDSGALIITLDTTGPRIIARTPDGAHDLQIGALNAMTVTFNESVDFDSAGTGSFWLDDITLVGPEGPITPTGIASLGGNEYEVAFGSQTQRGAYTLSVGPEVSDLAGNSMDQDGDGNSGESLQDTFMAVCSAFNADTVLASNMTITETDTTYDGQEIVINGSTVAIDGYHEFTSVHLVNGAVLTHTANTATDTHKLDLTVTDAVIVDSTSRIDVSGQGYLNGRTTGNTTDGGATGQSGLLEDPEAGQRGGIEALEFCRVRLA